MEDENIKDADSSETASHFDLDASQASPERAQRRDSESMFTESPVYDVDTQELSDTADKDSSLHDAKRPDDENSTDVEDAVMDKEFPLSESVKRKLPENVDEQNPKIQKMESEHFDTIDTQDLNAEVAGINVTAGKRKLLEGEKESSSIGKSTTPVRSSPRKITKRSNSCTCHDNVTTRPRTPRARAASVDVTKQLPGDASSPKKVTAKFELTPLNYLVSKSEGIRLPNKETIGTIQEETNIDPNDSQNFHLQLSPSPADDDLKDIKLEEVSISAEKTRCSNTLRSNLTQAAQNLKYNSSEQSNGHSQSLLASYHQKTRLSAERTTDSAERTNTTDSVNSHTRDIPGPSSTVTSKLITKLSNGDSSTPSDPVAPKHAITISDNEDSTPDSNKSNVAPKRFAAKNESFRISNSSTPSTISPLQNGHNFPLHTPSNPSFDIHISHDEDGEFLSMYVVRTDNDLGLDMCKEYQRVSKRFTMDPYLADVSKNSSPSSVTSGGLLPLPLPHPSRFSSVSTISSSTSSSSAGNRTSDGAFIVPQPPGKALAHQSTTSVRGCKALLKKIHEIFSNVPDAAEDAHRFDDKVSVDVQVSPGLTGEKHSNGTASPEEISRCDRATPKSSLKKTKVKGRRPLSAKTKRAILPTQAEEPEYLHGMNSPEMIPSGGERDASDKVVAATMTTVGTPKSVNKAKERRRVRAESPRPATPLEAPFQSSGHAPGTPVLAKWVDKRYYSGKVVEMLDPGKYQIEFDDGHTKTLLEEFIIFGSANELPLEGQSVYAMVDDEQTYEPGLVLAVEHNSRDTVTYRCTTDGEATVSVTASELYMTEDQARLLKESVAPRSPPATPSTPRRRLHRELDLDNIIQGPRSARVRDKGSAKKRLTSPKSPKASTSGIKVRVATPVTGRKQRQVSESSEVSEGSSSGAPPAAAAAAADAEVPGVEPEVQRTPRKIDGIKAGPLQLKGAARQTTGKKNSKLSKFENDAATVALLGPIPQPGTLLFSGLHFLLTCSPAKQPMRPHTHLPDERVSSEDAGGDTSSCSSTDYEGREYSKLPFHKERLREQLEAGGGTVHAQLDDVPQQHYTNTRLIANRACCTAKYIQCLAVDVRPLCHSWVIASCAQRRLQDEDSFALPAGWSHRRNAFVNWTGAAGRRGGGVLKDKLVLLCGEEHFVKFWERVCTLVGARTRVVREERAEPAGALVVLTDPDCPHELQNEADQEGVPLVSPTWLVQCLIEGRVCPPAAHHSYSFLYIT